MDDRKEKVANLISKLIVRFYDTPESFFIALVETLIERNFGDEDIGRMVDNTIYNVHKTKLTVADVMDGLAKSVYEFVFNGKRCYGDRSMPDFIPDDAPPRPRKDYIFIRHKNTWENAI